MHYTYAIKTFRITALAKVAISFQRVSDTHLLPPYPFKLVLPILLFMMMNPVQDILLPSVF